MIKTMTHCNGDTFAVNTDYVTTITASLWPVFGDRQPATKIVVNNGGTSVSFWVRDSVETVVKHLEK